jgi:hypothetical protein
MKRHLLFLTMAALGATLPAFASLTYTCDPNIDTTQAGTCAALQGSTVAGVYNGIFGNSITSSVYVKYAPIGGYGESFFNVTPVPYSVYYAALLIHDPAAASTLTAVDPLIAYGNTDQDVDITPALASALGIVFGGANTAGVLSDGITSCTIGVTAFCYSGVVEILSGQPFDYPLSPADSVNGLDFFSIVEHETDETLGTISCIGTNGSSQPYDQCTPNNNPNAIVTDAAPGDLFRYASADGTRSFLNADSGSTAYFSNDGGVTLMTHYINSPNSGDYGDWDYFADGSVIFVQDAAASNGTYDISTDGPGGKPGPEVALLNAVGFTDVPEPRSIALLGASLAALIAAGMGRRRNQVPRRAQGTGNTPALY